MQLYAYDRSGQLIFSCHAKKQVNYCCLECGSIVRLREGMLRHSHFFHLKKSSCRQSGKSLIHIQLQLYLKNQLPEDEASLEYRFDEINRIADVAWHEKKIIFEIQCSPISKEEMESRVHDYQAVGYQVVWILHDARFNKWRLSSVELGLINIPHYYTNMNETGKGMIYDQWQHKEKGIRIHFFHPLPVDLRKPYLNNGHLGFHGDLHSLDLFHPYRKKIKDYLAAHAVNKRRQSILSFFNMMKQGLKDFIKNRLRPYCK